MKIKKIVFSFVGAALAVGAIVGALVYGVVDYFLPGEA